MKTLKHMKAPNPMNRTFTTLSHQVIGGAIEVHRVLGPGLLASAYRHCLAHELRSRGLEVKLERPMPILYKGQRVECGYIVDLLVENEILLEVKSITELEGIHTAQMIAFMKLAQVRQGFLINFNVGLLKDGLNSYVL